MLAKVVSLKVSHPHFGEDGQITVLAKVVDNHSFVPNTDPALVLDCALVG